MTMKLDRPLQLRSHLSGGAPAARADAATPLEIVDPWRGDLAATLECGGDSSVATAVQSAKAAYRSNGGQTRAQRAQWLEKAADLIADSQELLVELSVRTIGKPRKAAKFEILRSAAFVRACARQSHEFAGELVPLDSSPAGVGRYGIGERVPYGVVAAITPLNAPANLLVQKVAPALVTGNAVIVKPSQEGAAVALSIPKLFNSEEHTSE